MQWPAQEASPKQAAKPTHRAENKISLWNYAAADKLLLTSDLASLKVASTTGYTCPKCHQELRIKVRKETD